MSLALFLTLAGLALGVVTGTVRPQAASGAAASGPAPHPEQGTTLLAAIWGTLDLLRLSLIRTGLSSLDILMIVAGAGFIIGTLHITGLGFALTVMLVDFGGGSLFLLLVIAALLCIVLGMGMPTAGVYILLAVLIAPSLAKVGIDPLAAHMFILYLGMMSLITPPVAVAAFFAASIAGAPPMKTAGPPSASAGPRSWCRSCSCSRRACCSRANRSTSLSMSRARSPACGSCRRR